MSRLQIEFVGNIGSSSDEFLISVWQYQSQCKTWY